MWRLNATCVLLAATAACTSDSDAAAKFVGSWAYGSASTVAIDCGGTPSSESFATVVETFVEQDGHLVKHDNQGCTGLVFDVSADVATLSPAGQSCAIPASGTSPAATFLGSSYAFTLDADTMSLAEALIGTYTVSGDPTCDVTATNTLTRQE
jgi:hypothetical protein